MKKTQVTPLEEIAFAKYMGELSGNFRLDNNDRLSWDVRHSQLFRGFRDGYFDFPNKYQNMSQWKQELIQFFLGGDYITAYDLFYYKGQRHRNKKPQIQFVEVA